MIPQEDWMNLRALRPLVEAGYPWTEIARIAGCDWRTAKKYLAGESGRPPAYRRRPPVPKLIDPVAGVIDEWIRLEPAIRATTIYERLVAEPYRFGGSYQRVKLYVRRRRPEIVGELGQTCMHRRFTVLPGAQGQVDWGDEGTITTPVGDLAVYSFHMVLSYSRDPFCRYTTSTDLATFWGAHRLAFAHFGGVPAALLYDRTKTVVRTHVGRGDNTPLHPEAIAFASHYDFAIHLCAPYRPQTKGRVERVVGLTREKVLAGRTFASIDEMQAAWEAWLPTRRAQVHRTHGEVIALRAERDRAALLPLPERDYLVCDRHLRVVGRDALVSFEASCYSVPWTLVRPGQRVELRASREGVAIWTLPPTSLHLATHPRAPRRGSWVVDEAHWDGLPDGNRPGRGPADALRGVEPAMRARIPHVDTPVARRDLTSYDRIFHEKGGTW
jgi:transposase